MSKGRILVVEDESITALDINRQLTHWGYLVVAVAGYGEEALQQAAELRPDLALLDVKLKGAMDGVQVAEQLQALFDIPVVYLTAYADEATLQRAKVTAPYGYVVKPFEAKDLVATIETALYRHQIERKLIELNKIGQAINSSLDLEETLTIIMHHTTHLLGVEAASVVLCDLTRNDMWFAAASGKGADFVRGKRLAIGHGIVGWVVEHSEPALVPDAWQDARFFNNFDQQSGFTSRSILCVPLQTYGRTIGAIEAVNKEGDSFGQEDLRLLISVAAPAATAIENARLHAETERRAEQLAALHELDRAITARLHITDVYYAIARRASQLLPYHRLSITLIHGDAMHLAYITEDETSPPAGIRLPLKTSSAGWVAARGQPLLRHNMADDVRFPGDEPLMMGGIQSAMVIPLRVKGRVIGTCNIGSRQIGAYSPDHLAIAQLMADQLAIAIENARLYEAEHHARETAEILRAANLAFTQTLDLDAVLGALMDYLHQFIAYDRATVVLLEEDAGPTVRATWGDEAGGSETRFFALRENLVSKPISSIEEAALIRQVFESQESLLLSDMHWQQTGVEQPIWQRLGPSWLGVPLVANGEIIGVCAMDKAQAGFFTQEHRQLAESLVLQAAIAIQNARLFEQVRVGRERLQNLSRRLVEVQETERRHIARELHDQAGQALTSLMVGLRLLEESSCEGQAVGAHVAVLKSTANGVLESLHRLASDLRPASLDHLGLGAALRQYTDAFSRQHNMVVQFEMVGQGLSIQAEQTLERLSPAMETALYRIVQEGLTNVARHAQATHVSVLLACHGDRVITIVEDNGLGFDPMAATHSGRLGLLGMRERAEMLGGTLTVESSPGIGTTLCVEVPYGCSHSDRR